MAQIQQFASSNSSLILSVNDELKLSLRQSGYSVQLMLTDYSVIPYTQ